MLWQVLVQFILRLSFGIAAAMSVTSAQAVGSGFYRIHLWVVLGLNTFVALTAWSGGAPVPHGATVAGVAVASAVCSYVGSVLWLYECRRAGTIVLYLVALLCFTGAVLATPLAGSGVLPVLAALLDILTAGLLLGFAMAAMLLGHWYLNSPTMQLAPLRRLLVLLGTAVVVRAGLCAVGLVAQWRAPGLLAGPDFAFLTLRWLAGLVGAFVLAVMAWQTLKVPNTQSATGILYVGVIFVFLGELTSQLLSVDSLYGL